MLAPGVDHEAIGERRVLARGAAQGGPELLLAEGDRVIRDHRLSRVDDAEEGSRGWGSRTTGCTVITCQCWRGSGAAGQGAAIFPLMLSQIISRLVHLPRCPRCRAALLIATHLAIRHAIPLELRKGAA